MNITIELLFDLARGLRSEHGENPEYDRALVELCTDAAGESMEQKPEIAAQLGITLDSGAIK